jgi:hypothetical protein
MAERDERKKGRMAAPDKVASSSTKAEKSTAVMIGLLCERWPYLRGEVRLWQIVKPPRGSGRSMYEKTAGKCSHLFFA